MALIMRALSIQIEGKRQGGVARRRARGPAYGRRRLRMAKGISMVTDAGIVRGHQAALRGAACDPGQVLNHSPEALRPQPDLRARQRLRSTRSERAIARCAPARRGTTHPRADRAASRTSRNPSLGQAFDFRTGGAPCGDDDLRRAEHAAQLVDDHVLDLGRRHPAEWSRHRVRASQPTG